MTKRMRQVVVMGPPGRLREAVADHLRQEGRAATVIGPDHDDPLDAALGSQAVIYLPCARLSDPPAASLERMRAALAAAHAPGVEVLVAVLPLEGFDDELDVLRRDGVPYVVLRAPTLLEELAAEAQGRRLALVPKGATVRTMAAADLARATLAAIDAEEQGGIEELGEAPLELATALRHAADSSGRQLRVVALWPWLLRAWRWIARMFRRRPALLVGAREPAALPACASGGEASHA